MSSNQEVNGKRSRVPRRAHDEGARRGEILAAAIDRFGRNGYENTKWADIADDVGVGPTALYHYFDSKQHCLYVILGDALSELHERFDTITADHANPDKRSGRYATTASSSPSTRSCATVSSFPNRLC